MPEIPRYFPLPDLGANVTAPWVENLSTVVNRTSSPPLLRSTLTLFEPLAIPLVVLAASVLVAITLLLLLTVWYGREIPAPVRYLTITRRRPEGLPVELFEYAYAGMKLVLRGYYLRLREALGCKRCTPRELATMSGRWELEKFAKLYEDVVYGSKEAGPESEEILARLDGAL